MPPRLALYFGCCAGTIGWALAFAVPAFAPTPVLWYYPLAHRWTFEVRATALAMDWYGRSLLAALAGALLFALAYGVARRVKAASPRGFVLWAAWTATAIALSAGLYSFQLATRQPVPEPLPPAHDAD